MQAPKKILSIFSFNKAQIRFLKICVYFFTPVVIAYFILEMMVLNIPMNYKILGQYLDNHAEELKVMALGSSQMKNAFNAALCDKEAINFGSTSQHHNEDFHIIKGTQDRTPNLKYILLEVSYNHLDLPHHPNDYWKNTIYLKYYGVNAFERRTYFQDKLVYLSNPPFYSIKLMDYYFYHTDKSILNEQGFDTNNYFGDFKKLDYDESKIAKHKLRIVNRANLDIFKTNTEYLYKMLDYLKKQNLNVIVCSIPLYKAYVIQRDINIVRRRDSVLGIIKNRYDNVTILNKETDTINFTVKDFLNGNHLNPDGAKKFTSIVNKVLDSIN